MTEEFRQQWLEAMQEYSKALEVEDDSVEIITNPSDVDSSVSMPAVKLDADGRVEKYVQIRYATLATAISNAQTLLGQIDADATALHTTVQTLQEEARQAQEIIDDLDGVDEQVEQLGRAIEQANVLITQLNTALQTAASDHATAQADHTQAQSDHTRAESDHTKVQGAENVNAELNGITVTITNRSGQSKSVDIGFDIYRTYTSVAAMNADASNVPLGKFVMIATTDKTSAENARMYIKSSQGNFRFLCDLDQASAEAWADWLNNMKPVIETATTDAINATSAANAAAHDANTAASNADASCERIEENEQTRESNETTRQDNEKARVSAETTRQTNWDNWFSDTLSTGVRTLWDNFWAGVNTSWNTFFGTDYNSGVRGEWNTLRDDVISKTQAAQTATTNANTAASNADSKATIANDAATNANNKAEIAQTAADNADEIRVQIESNEQTRQSNEEARVTAENKRQTDWTDWFSDTLPNGVRKLWNDFWANINASWTSFFGANEDSGVRGEWKTLKSDIISKTQAADTSTSNANTAASNADNKAAVADSAASNANNKAALANEKAALADEKATRADNAAVGAEKVNATISGTTLTVTDRNGASSSVDTKGEKGDDMTWQTMSQEDKDALIDTVVDEASKKLNFASIETCESIINELT